MFTRLRMSSGVYLLPEKCGLWRFLLGLANIIGFKLNLPCRHFSPEPNNFPAKFNTSISASQLAKDFEKLKSLVAEKSPGTRFIAGPDINSRSELLPRYVVTLLLG